MKTYFTYIVASESGTLYIGVTNDLVRKIFEHREGFVDGFTRKYGSKKPVYFESTEDVYAAIEREKYLKSWNRKRKERLIREMNPSWKDLYEDIV